MFLALSDKDPGFGINIEVIQDTMEFGGEILRGMAGIKLATS